MEDFNNIFDEDVYSPASKDAAQELISKLHSGGVPLSPSSLKAFSESPMAFINHKCGEDKQTPAKLLGSVQHAFILEPESAGDKYMVSIAHPLNTAEGRIEWAKFVKEKAGIEFDKNKQGNPVLPKKDELYKIVKNATGKELVPRNIYDQAKFRARCLRANRASMKIIQQFEQTEVWLPDGFEINGVKFRGIIDGLGLNIIGDIKNVPDATILATMRTIRDRAIPWQMWIYREAFGGGHGCYVLAVDGKGEVSCVRLTDRQLDQAGNEVIKCVGEFKRAVLLSALKPEEMVWNMSQDYWSGDEDGIFYM